MKHLLFKNPLFLICLGAFSINLTIALTYRFCGSENPEKKSTLYGSDARGYYNYLTWATTDDTHFEESNSNPRGHGRILKYTYGTALFQSPFYGAARLLDQTNTQKTTLHKTDEWLLCIGASLYLALALGFLYQLVGKFSTHVWVKATTVCFIYLATNLLHYASIELMMSHLYSFLSITGYLYFTLHYQDTRQKKQFSRSLLFLFLLMAVRPFNLILVIPWMAYQYISLRSVKLFLASALTITLAIAIQFIFWRLQCGSWTLTSYDGEGFYWLRPQFLNVLFSFRKGLFLYSPIIVFACVGFAMKWTSHQTFKTILLLSLAMFTYAVACWWHWPYGDSYGHRAFIDVYSMAAIGLVVFLDHLKQSWSKLIAWPVLLFFLLLNLIQTWQFNHGILAPEYMNQDKYKFVFLKTGAEFRNCLGGQNDILPYKRHYEITTDSLPVMNMNSQEYSVPLDETFSKKNTGCYVNISFVKEETKANQSGHAGLFFQITDSLNQSSFFYGIPINETPNDFKRANTKYVSYQVILPALREKENLRIVFSNPDRQNFKLKHVLVKRYYFISQ